MSKFYLLLWLQWALKMTLSSVLLAAFLSAAITVILYIKKGAVAVSTEVIDALAQVFIFWFPIVWSLTLLLALFRSLKHIFNNCYNGYKLQLYECNTNETIEVIGFGDLVKVWRRWFMLMIWLSAAQMIVALGIQYIFTSYSSLFEWFNIYILFAFILASGYLSFILLVGKCKKVKLAKC